VSIETGRLVNREFHVSDSEDLYLSPSIAGELYWNFGWPGVILGMAIIGAAVGALACRFNLAEAKTVTGLLVIVITIQQVIVAFEGSFSPIYVVWFRSLGAIAILHFLFARVSVNMKSAIPGHAISAAPLKQSIDANAFPNLLR
jgi:lipopolysaccharide export LptBFGC system permease protein LptF